MFEPITTEINPARTVETVSISLQGDGSNGASVTALQTLRDRVIPSSVGSVDGVDDGGDRRDRGHARLQRADEEPRAARVRVRARALLRAAARDVQVDRDPDSRRCC